jgi:O-antigen ligase
MWGFWVFRSRRADTAKYVIPAAALLVGILLLAPATVGERVATMTDSRQRAQQGSIQVRLVQYEFALKAFASSPLIGVGALNFKHWAQQQPGGRGIHHNVHNAYLGILAEQGLAGFVPYMMLLVLSWKQYSQAWRAARARRAFRDPELALLGTYALFLQIALLGSAVSGLAIIMQNSKIAWLLMALSPVVRNLVFQHIDLIKARNAAPEFGREDPSPAAAVA